MRHELRGCVKAAHCHVQFTAYPFTLCSFSYCMYKPDSHELTNHCALLAWLKDKTTVFVWTVKFVLGAVCCYSLLLISMPILFDFPCLDVFIICCLLCVANLVWVLGVVSVYERCASFVSFAIGCGQG